MAISQGYNYDPQAWWRQQSQRHEITRIRESQKVEQERLDFQKEKYNEILAMYKKFGDLGEEGDFAVPEQFGEASAFADPRTGAGMDAVKGLSREAGQRALAAGQIGSAKTGMSSGTNIAGLGARVESDRNLANQQAYLGFSSQFQTAKLAEGQAGLTTQQLRAQQEAERMRVLASFA